MKFDVLNRFSGAVQFTAEIDCSEDAETSIKLGLAVRWAIKSSADLSYADLRYADLSSADLISADLRSADLLIFQGFGTAARTLYAHKGKDDGIIQIRTGCFFGTIDEFKNAVKEKHGNNHHGKDYKALCKLIEQKFKGE